MNRMKRSFLVKRRKKMGFTQHQIATYLNITTRYYQKIESGEHNPSLKIIQKMEDLFQLPQRILLAKDDEITQLSIYNYNIKIE